MFEKLQTGEKIHDAPGQPQTCSHPIYFIPRCAFSPTTGAKMLASWCYLYTPLISHSFFTTA